MREVVERSVPNAASESATLQAIARLRTVCADVPRLGDACDRAMAAIRAIPIAPEDLESRQRASQAVLKMIELIGDACRERREPR